MRGMEETNRICPWCSTPIPSTASACPKCGALVEGAVAQDIPGLTVVDPKATLGTGEGLVPDFVDPKALLQVGKRGDAVDSDAIRPPSEAVRLEMRKIELEAEIENAGRSVMSASDGVADNVKKPSREALKAFEAGLLDSTGPAGETDFVERARALEEEEKR